MAGRDASHEERHATSVSAAPPPAIPVSGLGHSDAPSPVAQAEQTGFHLLGEFMLRPGDDPYVLALHSDPRRLAARHRRLGGRRDDQAADRPRRGTPLIATANPAVLRFEGVAAKTYGVARGVGLPYGVLGMLAVGLLYGGPEGALAVGSRRRQQVATPAGDSRSVRPLRCANPAPRPVAPGASPLPPPTVSLSELAPRPLPEQAVLDTLMAPLDLRVTPEALRLVPAPSPIVPPPTSVSGEGRG